VTPPKTAEAMDYQELERQDRVATAPHDLSAAWGRCQPIPDTNSQVQAKIKSFCERKRFSIEALTATGARVVLRGRGPDVFLAWAGHGRVNGRRAITAVKYRHIETGKRYAEPRSSWQEPIIAGDVMSRDWFVVEGETDTARLVYLVGDVAAVMCLPAGALTIRSPWLGHIPGGATIYLALDADQTGDQGALKAQRMLFQHAVRVRPDVGKDWCEWPGDCDDFVALVRREKSASTASLLTVDDLLMQYIDERVGSRPPIQLGWGSIDSDIKGVGDGQVLGIAARTAVGKSWALASVADHTASTGVGGLICTLEMPGVDWIERQLAICENVRPEVVEGWVRQGLIANKTQHFREKFKYTLFCEKIVALDEMPMLIQAAKKRISAEFRVVFVDYLGLMDARGRDVYERVSAIGKGLKTVAKREGVAVVVAMQLSRAGGDGSKEVTLEMLRDSGVLEESMDFLLGCWRKQGDKNVMYMRILKNRKGTDGRKVELRFLERSRKLVEPVGVAV
jgi:DnaB-like helicase C terminal domain